MPAHGQHRKPRASRRLTRLGLVAGTGGAALALPLLTATHAGAATPAKAPALTAAATTAQAARTAHAAATTYTVVHGDTLSSIATSHHVKGGWHRLYAVNRGVIGSNPDLIHPGEHLSLKVHPAAHPAAAKPSTAAKPAAPTAARTTAATTAAKPAAKAAPAAAPASTGYTKPVGDAPIGTGYKASGSLWASGAHTGVDFLVGSGTPVHAVAAGTVVSAGADGAYGNDVIIRHADGKYTLYGHLTTPLVSAGQSVTEGQEIGISGATGNVTGPHLHFEVRTTPDYGSDIDPVAYMASHGVTI